MKAVPRTPAASSIPLRHRAALGAAAAVACSAMVLGGFAATAQAADPAAIDDIILLTGADESQRVVNWYASASTAQVVQVAPTSKIANGEFPAARSPSLRS